MSTSTHTAWATEAVTFFPNDGMDILEFLQVPGNGKLTARHFLDFNAKKNELMDIAGEAKRIVVGIDPMLILEASYIVNNLLCAVIGADRGKITLEPAPNTGNTIAVYFYQDEMPVAKSTAKRHHHSMPHGRRHHGVHHLPVVHIF